MAELDDFRGCLVVLTRTVSSLIVAARQQKDALVAGDLGGIETARLEQEKLVADLVRARTHYRAVLECLAQGPLPDGDEGAGLAGLWEELLAGYARLREITVTNRLLATRAVIFYRKVSAILQPDRKAGTYGDSGRFREAPAPVISRVV